MSSKDQPPGARSPITLRSLEALAAVHRFGSIQEAAQRQGLAPSTLSHHIARLEDAVSERLVDHDRRPVRLTPAGRVLANHAESVLAQMREAVTDVRAAGAGVLQDLRFGAIEDLEDAVVPRFLAWILARKSSRALSYVTGSSHDLLKQLSEHRIDLAVANRDVSFDHGLTEWPLLHDPFVLMTPADWDGDSRALFDGAGPAFLSFGSDQIIQRQIEAHLRRHQIVIPPRISIDSNQVMMGLVDRGAGWAISTPLSWLRGRQSYPGIALHPFPYRAFRRTISLFSGYDPDRMGTARLVAQLRGLITEHVMVPILDDYPWLEAEFSLTPADPES
ncbi:MAG: LysR family transcriptional regulator [Pseudomonadota bacterium]